MYNSLSSCVIIHGLAAVLFLAGLNKDPNDEPDIKDFNSWKTLAEKERQKGTFKYMCIS